MEKLRNGKFTHQIATAQEVKNTIAKLNVLIEKYSWQNRKIHPYGWAENLIDFIKHFSDFENVNFSSKTIIISEINGLIDIVNVWIEQEQEEKVTIRMICGKRAGTIKEVRKTTADEFIAEGWAELV